MLDHFCYLFVSFHFVCAPFDFDVYLSISKMRNALTNENGSNAPIKMNNVCFFFLLFFFIFQKLKETKMELQIASTIQNCNAPAEELKTNERKNYLYTHIFCRFDAVYRRSSQTDT